MTQGFYGNGISTMAVNRNRSGYSIKKIPISENMYFTLYFNGVLYFLHFDTKPDVHCYNVSFDVGGPSLLEAVEKAVSRLGNELGERLWSWFLEFNERMSVMESDEYYISMRGGK